MALLPAIFRFAPASGGIPRPTTTTTTTWRTAAGAGAATARFSPGKQGRQGTRTASKGLRLSRTAPQCYRCPADLIPPERWWEPELRPEDLVEPTGQGLEELKAIRDALVRDPLQPIGLAVKEVVATGGNLFRCQSFHAGVLTGPLLIVAGLCKLYTVAPNLFMDIVLGYIFYKLSVLAANLKRNGKANDICARIQCVVVFILFLKCNNPTKDFYYRFTEFLWTFACQVYGCRACSEIIGFEHPRQELEGLFKAILRWFKEVLYFFFT
ncbi:unnamed protein product [Urochloa decumbens]|uniref:Uncharacterized protein n=1 Tax=Urochloa decumbens TaxID=240449 RepID=A0ABC8VIA7_9POAL